MSGWSLLLVESFYSRDGRHERLGILKGPTYPCEFYVGPFFDDFGGQGLMPRFNSTEFYHRTDEDALTALTEMVDNLR